MAAGWCGEGRQLGLLEPSTDKHVERAQFRSRPNYHPQRPAQSDSPSPATLPTPTTQQIQLTSSVLSREADGPFDIRTVTVEDGEG